jgi:hypothetical protein
VPPANKVCVASAPIDQKPVPGLNSCANNDAVLPMSPVMVTCGSKLAMATPTWAVAACSAASAARTSGRRSTSCDGTPSGKSAGRTR